MIVWHGILLERHHDITTRAGSHPVAEGWAIGLGKLASERGPNRNPERPCNFYTMFKNETCFLKKSFLRAQKF
jgi:hypothetical protein